MATKCNRLGGCAYKESDRQPRCARCGAVKRNLFPYLDCIEIYTSGLSNYYGEVMLLKLRDGECHLALEGHLGLETKPVSQSFANAFIEQFGEACWKESWMEKVREDEDTNSR